TNNLKEINTATPICGIKIFMGASTGDLLIDQHADLERIFANGQRLIAVHAEDEQRIQTRKAHYLRDPNPDISLHSVIRDPKCALLATTLAVELSEKYQRRLHILHLSTALEVDYLRRHKPAWVTAEVIPNHLLLNTADYAQLGSLVQMNPPIREPSDNGALWQGLHDGVIDFIATDHAPHTLHEKQQPYPNSPSGMPGVETSLPLLLTEMQAGHCKLQEVLKWLSAGPAIAYNIINKGRIEEGFDADLTLVDMEHFHPVRNEDVVSRAGWSPYVGHSLTGWPQYTIVNGRIIYEKGRIHPGRLGKALCFNHAEE
ncbi:MAG TPA: dihydroorotase, partial [Gammaproteobacteria bacterium]|nr:dihydroorotase [Gammaproteobacteria bacterium]